MAAVKLKTDIVVAGGGPTGLAAALACANNGFDVVLLAPKGTHVDTDARTTALMMPSIDLMTRLGVWDACMKAAAPLRVLRIIDDTNRLMRAPTVDFHASEIDEYAFGYNIANQTLNGALADKVAGSAAITQIDAMVSGVGFDDECASVTLSDGQLIEAKLVVGADGVHSGVRQSARIDVRAWDYPQTACVMAFDHARPHNSISTEFHTPAGPCTQVPLPGNRSSLVWVRKPEDVPALMALDDDALCRAVEARLHSTLGKISKPTKLQAWPLSSRVAHRFSDKRVVLIGQAAHAFPPIGAQGLNLGFRDIEDLSAALARGVADPGAQSVTSTYDRKRRADVYLRTGAVDLLNRSLLSGFAPLQLGRAVGMSALKNVGPLRSLFMYEGIKPGSSLRNMFKRKPDDETA